MNLYLFGLAYSTLLLVGSFLVDEVLTMHYTHMNSRDVVHVTEDFVNVYDDDYPDVEEIWMDDFYTLSM